MPDISAWSWMAKDSVVIEPYVGQNKNGEAVYGTAVTYEAHCQGKSQRVVDIDRQERISTVTSYLIGAVAVTPRDRITLPSRFSPTQPPILAVGQPSWQHGWHHTVVYT